jgi:exodeoxyribonuclease V alpha subunit
VSSSAKPQAEPSTQEVLAGLVERVTYHNGENGFCVLRIKARGHRDLVAVVGHTATIAAGEWVTASGEWINDRTHGQQRAINALTFTASSSVHLAVGRTIILKLSFSRCGASVMSTARCA